MEHILNITFVGISAGVVGTAIGGILALFFSKASNKIISFVLEFSAGLMVAVVCFDLLPNAFEMSNFLPVLLGIFSGVMFAMYMQEKIKYSPKAISSGKSGLLGTGIMMFASIAAHHFPEGLAIGSGYEASTALGISLTIVLIFHDIPEGLALALPLKKSGVSSIKVVLAAAICGIPTGIGAFVGVSIGYISKDIIAICLAAAGGAMLYVSIGDLVAESKQIYSGRWSSVGNVLGMLVGLIISYSLG